jgi:OmpA-OmpF porin, OOP family
MKNLSYYKKAVKKLFLLFLVLFQFTDVKAQNKYGIMGGVGITSLNKIPKSTGDESRYSSTTSCWGGLIADFSLGNSGLSLFTAAIYNKRGYDYSLQNQIGTINTLKDSACSQKLNYIDLNITLRKYFAISKKTNFFIGAGPSVNIFMSGTEQISHTYFGNENTTAKTTKTNLAVGNDPGAYKRAFLSLNAVTGFEFNQFSVWLNYNLPLGYYYGEPINNLQHKLSTFGINAGYTLASNNRPHREKKEKKEKPSLPVTIANDTTTDNDGDGIANINDKCPGHKGVAKYGGCPVPDSDGDGINDEEDTCPQVKGLAAKNGCPEFTETEKSGTKDTLHFIVYFEPGKSILRTEAFNTLSEVVKLLKANPKLQVIFNGHTDNAGSIEANSIRAFDRALVCADYAASFYINRNRLVVAAYGNKMPVADLNDPLLQWKNRRVEIYVFEKDE